MTRGSELQAIVRWRRRNLLELPGTCAAHPAQRISLGPGDGSWIAQLGRADRCLEPTGSSERRIATTTAAPVAITFVNRGGRGDPFFWASSADDAEAITIEVVDRSNADPVTVSFQLPDPSIRVAD